MATPRVTVDETLALSRVTVSDTAPRVAVSESGSTTGIQVTATSEVVSVVLSQSAAGVTSVNGQTGAVTGIATTSGVATSIAAIDFPVDSVNGKTNTVVLTTSDIAEGSNEYYTSARVNSAFDTRLATKTTDNLTQGSTNKYFSNTLARSAISASGSLSYDSGTGVISYTTPTTIASISNHDTDDLAEGGTNLYFTNQRAIDAVGGSGSTITPGRWDSPYTQNSAIRGFAQWAAGGTNNFSINNTSGSNDITALNVTGWSTHTQPLQKWTASSNTVASMSTAGVLTANSLSLTTYPTTSNITEGTNLYYTNDRADARVAIGIANLVDSAPGTLDTLNELAAALGDDPNYATTITTALGTKLATADFTSTANTWIATKTTANLAENTNLYYTDVRARTALSAGTGVGYDSGTGVISIGQAVGTTSDVTFNTIDSNIVDGNYVVGQLIATRNTGYTPPVSALTTISGQNGIAISSSIGGANGYGANIAVRYHTGDTTAAGNNAASIVTSGATGTSTSPAGVGTNLVLGAYNFDGYTTSVTGSANYASTIATTNQGGGTTAISPLQAQVYARQNFTSQTTVTTAVTGASGTGSVATLTFTLQNTAPYVVGQSVTIAGMTPSGYNGTVVITAATTSSISYANATTGFTSGGTIGAANTVTAAGTGFRVRGFANSTVMSAANRFNFMDLTASAATFKANAYTFADEVITGSTLTAKNYMTLGATTGSINQDTLTLKNNAATTTYATFASTGHTLSAAGLHTFTRTTTGTPGAQEGRPALNIQLTRTDQATPNNGDSTSFRTRVAGSNGTFYTLSDVNTGYATNGNVNWNLSLANGDQTTGSFSGLSTLTSSITSTTIRAGTASGTPGGSSVNDIMVISDTKILNNRPHRSAVTTHTMARGSTYTPAVGVNNFIELTLTAGTDPTYIDVDNLTVAGEGGHQAILVYNNSGSAIGNNDLVIRNNGTAINSTQDTIANGARVIFTVYCVGNYASCEYMIAA